MMGTGGRAMCSASFVATRLLYPPAKAEANYYWLGAGEPRRSNRN